MVPITLVILVGLFVIQKRGTAAVGALFGPAMLVWFGMIAALGLPWVLREPRVLEAVLPWHGVRFLASHGVHGFLILGAVVLCITGTEALYADMGHFGRRPIRLAWFVVVFPCLLLNYFGQGAALLLGGERGGGQPVLRARARRRCSTRSSWSRRWPRSSPRRPSSRAASRSPSRRCSSATRRA